MQFTHFVPSILWAIIILLGSSIPGSDLPDSRIVGVDKVFHFFFYLVLEFLLNVALVKQFIFSSIRYKAGTIAVGIAFLYGVGIEIMQHLFFEERSFELLDVLANGAGCLAGIIIFKLVYYKIID